MNSLFVSPPQPPAALLHSTAPLHSSTPPTPHSVQHPLSSMPTDTRDTRTLLIAEATLLSTARGDEAICPRCPTLLVSTQQYACSPLLAWS